MAVVMRLTAAQAVLQAAAKIHEDGKAEFSEWDLTVSAWKQDPNRFGCRGYETVYPDHKRVMAEIMGTTKKDNPIRHGWIKKIAANQYRITPLGLAEAERLEQSAESGVQSGRSAQHLYDSLSRYVFHYIYRDWLADVDEPRTWLGVQAFIGMRQVDATSLNDGIREIEEAVEMAIEFMEWSGQDRLQRGPTGGGKVIHRREVERLREFVDVLRIRFSPQMDAIRSRG